MNGELFAGVGHAQLSHLSVQIRSVQPQACCRISHVAATCLNRGFDVRHLELLRRLGQHGAKPAIELASPATRVAGELLSIKSAALIESSLHR